MTKLLWLVGATMGGAAGWWLGAFVGIMTAVVLSAVGTGLGIYVARRVGSEYL